MGAFRLVSRLLRRVARAGTAEYSGFRRREIILVNQLCLIGIGTTTLYQCFFLAYGPGVTWPVLLVNTAILLAYALALAVNGSGRTIAARNTGIGVASVQLIATTWVLGSDAGMHLYYFALGGLASLIHTQVRAGVTFALASLSALLFVICEFLLDGSGGFVPLTEGALTALFAASALGTMFLCAYFLFVYRTAMYHAERELAEANRELAELSGSDALTRLANRRRMEQRLHEQWRQLARACAPMSVLMMDADHFKHYNDLYGHQAGDECLRRIACLATAAMQRSSDTVARYGGEEFLAILPETDQDNALEIAERLRSAIERTDMRDETAESPGGRWTTVSIGVSTMVPEASTTPETLINNADRALYEAKVQGRNRVVFCPPAGNPSPLAHTTTGDSHQP